MLDFLIRFNQMSNEILHGICKIVFVCGAVTSINLPTQLNECFKIQFACFFLMAQRYCVQGFEHLRFSSFKSAVCG